MESEESPQLLASLLKDARQFAAPVGDAVPFVVATYGAMGNRLSARPGYPRLYRCAWKLLQRCVATADWSTLQRIFDVLRVLLPGGEFDESAWLESVGGARELYSWWHLKAVLYCWAYLRDARHLGQGAEHDAALLAEQQRRTPDEGEAQLRALRPLHCFVNQTPQEAHRRLEQARRDDTERPYLFRLSTTLPGLVTLTLLAPVSRRPLDMRVSPGEAHELALQGDLYVELFARRLAVQASTYDVPALVDLLRQLEQPRHYDAPRLERRLRQVVPPELTEFRPALACALLKRAFWNRVSTRQLVAHSVEERVGLTASYIAAYTQLDPVELLAFLDRCANCLSAGLTEQIREPLNGQVYCSEQCYATDFRHCY